LPHTNNGYLIFDHAVAEPGALVLSTAALVALALGRGRSCLQGPTPEAIRS
jgi:hypothetical protein